MFLLINSKRKIKKDKAEKVEKTDKLVDPSSVSILGPTTSDDPVEHMDTSTPHSSTTPDPSEALKNLMNSLLPGSLN